MHVELMSDVTLWGTRLKQTSPSGIFPLEAGHVNFVPKRWREVFLTSALLKTALSGNDKRLVVWPFRLNIDGHFPWICHASCTFRAIQKTTAWVAFYRPFCLWFKSKKSFTRFLITISLDNVSRDTLFSCRCRCTDMKRLLLIVLQTNKPECFR